MPANNVSYCDLQHERTTRAVVRVQAKSTRIGRPGHPMNRELLLCSGHARQLRAIGLELVGGP
jgi:hypothetical protein